MRVLAQYIETSLWGNAIDLLLEHKWEMTYAYDGMDVGIDYNKVVFNRNNEEIVFEWTNWDEGEICCTRDRLKEIETLIGHEFKRVIAVDEHAPRIPRSSG